MASCRIANDGFVELPNKALSMKVRTLTRSLNGRPYHEPILESIRETWREILSVSESHLRLLDEDIQCSPSVDAASFRRCVTEFALTIHSGSPDQALYGASRFAGVVDDLVAAPQLDCDLMRSANAALLDKATSSFRTAPIWVGAAHPADAVLVGVSAASIPLAMRELGLFLNAALLPVVGAAALCLRQLLLLHPFADGNGRLGRALFLAVLARHFGRKPCFMLALSRLWCYRAMALHTALAEWRAKGKCDAYLALIADAFGEERRKAG